MKNCPNLPFFKVKIGIFESIFWEAIFRIAKIVIHSESTLRKAKIMDFLNYFLSNKKWQKYENNKKIVKKNYQIYQFVVNKGHF